MWLAPRDDLLRHRARDPELFNLPTAMYFALLLTLPRSLLDLIPDALGDFMRYSIAPKPESIAAYCWECVLMAAESAVPPRVALSVDETRHRIHTSSDAIRKHLPTLASAKQPTLVRGRLSLDPQAFFEWSNLLVDLTVIRRKHESARRARRHLRLLNKRPNDLLTQIANMTRLLPLPPSVQSSFGDGDEVEIELGRLVARASRHAKRVLEYRLRVADRELRPRGSYLRSRKAPRQLGAWKRVQVRMVTTLQRSRKRNTRQRAIAAAMQALASPPILTSVGPAEYARDVGLNLRRVRRSDRMTWTKEAMRKEQERGRLESMLRLGEREPVPQLERAWAPGHIAYWQALLDVHQNHDAITASKTADPHRVDEVGVSLIPLLLQADEWRSPFWEPSQESLMVAEARAARFASLIPSDS